MADWRPIETAPRDGRPVRVRRVYDGVTAFEGLAAWRTVTFPPYLGGGLSIPAETATGWMRVETDKRFPEPTDWLPEPPTPSAE